MVLFFKKDCQWIVCWSFVDKVEFQCFLFWGFCEGVEYVVEDDEDVVEIFVDILCVGGVVDLMMFWCVQYLFEWIEIGCFGWVNEELVDEVQIEYGIDDQWVKVDQNQWSIEQEVVC